jgi:hypothetical protein
MYKIITKEQLKTFEFCISCGSKNKISYLDPGTDICGEEYVEPGWRNTKFEKFKMFILKN